MDVHGYNDRSELTGTQRRDWKSDGNGPLLSAKWQFDYEYDNIGNRKTDTVDAAQTTYARTNALNEYEEISHPTSPGQEALAYDADGDMTHSGLVASDFDHDGDVDLTDFGYLSGCFNGPNNPPGPNCQVDADFDDDNDVDMDDYGAFAACANGPNKPPGCNDMKPMQYTWDAENP